MKRIFSLVWFLTLASPGLALAEPTVTIENKAQTLAAQNPGANGVTNPPPSLGSTGIQGLVCSSVTYNAPSGPSNNITFTFDRPYTCGQFANGDWYVVPDQPEGIVLVTGISPPMTSGRNGWEVNPTVGSPFYQPWDARVGGYQATSLSFPYSARADQSLVKAVSMGACDGQSCIQFAGVLTVLDSEPSSPGTTFRPPFVGTEKPLFSTLHLQTQMLNRYADTCCVNKISRSDALTRTKNFRLNYSPSTIWGYSVIPLDSVAYGRTWGGDMWKFDNEVLGWLNLNNACESGACSAEEDLAAKMPVVIGYVQDGIDVYGVNKFGQGYLRGTGGNGAGILMSFVFAAAMVNDARLTNDLNLVRMEHWCELNSFYRGRGGIALWGQIDVWSNTFNYWDELRSPPGSSKTIRDPHGYIDGGSIPGDYYQDTLSHQTVALSLLLRMMPRLRWVWPTLGDNANVLMEYGDRWHDRGTHTLPDGCAPPVGTYGVDYGGSSGTSEGFENCIPGAGRRPDLDGTHKNGGNRFSPFADQMYSAIRPLLNSTTLTVSLTAQPATIATGGASLLTWRTSQAATCVSAEFDTGGAIQGTVSVHPPATTTYRVTCQGAGGSASSSVEVVAQAGEDADGAVTVLPNPMIGTGKVRILSEAGEGVRVRVYNLAGERMVEKEQRGAPNGVDALGRSYYEVTVDAQDWPSGSYLIETEVQNGLGEKIHKKMALVN